MRVLMVLENVFPQDERVEKEIASLLDAGHEVRIATYSFEQCQRVEAYNGYQIYRARISRLMYKFGAAILILPFYFNFWKRYITKIFNEWQFDAIHIHDLPLAKIGIQMKRKYNVVFVADQHEYYSDWIVKTAHYNKGLGKIIKMLSNWALYEKKCLQQADLVCTVEQPLKELYISRHNISSEKLITVPNTPSKSIYGGPLVRNTEDSFTLFYCGGMDVLRGLETPIKALNILKKQIPLIKISLVGKPNRHFDYKAYAAKYGVEEYVELRGWVQYSALPAEIDKSDICFFTPSSEREEINNTIATKIYQYMARGKPLIVGRAKYMKEFVEKHRLGLAVDESNPEDFASAVLKIYQSAELRSEFEKNARKLSEKYFWENTVRPLLDFYNS